VQLAVTPEQISEWRLPSRPTKRSDARAAGFGRQRSVELDAIAPDRLRALVRAAIEQHLPAEQYEALKAAEQSETRRAHCRGQRGARQGYRAGGAAA